MTKSPKLYFSDTGLLCFLLNISDAQQFAASHYLGAVWETYIFSEIRKRQIAAAGGWSLNFWRDRSHEVDFVYHSGGRFDLLEAKWTQHPDRKDLAGLLAARDKLGETHIASSTVVCRASHSFPLGKDTQAVPLTDLLVLGN